MQRLRRDEREDRGVAPAHGRVVERRVGLVAFRQDERHHALGDDLAKRPRQAVADGVGRRVRLTIPLSAVPGTSARSALPLHRLVGERSEQQVTPARQEVGAGIELDGEQVARREVFARKQPIADDVRPRSDLVAAVAELRRASRRSTTRAFAVQMRPSAGRGCADTRRRPAIRSILAIRPTRTRAVRRRCPRAGEASRTRSTRCGRNDRPRPCSARACRARSPRRRRPRSFGPTRGA